VQTTTFEFHWYRQTTFVSGGRDKKTLAAGATIF